MLQSKNHIKSILLVDDDEDDHLLFTDGLSEIAPNLTVVCTRDFNKLSDILENARPCVIVMDLHMHEFFGYQFLEQVKSQPQFDKIPIVFWSDSCSVQSKNLAYKIGARYYFQKPFTFEKLLSELDTVVALSNESEVPA